MCNFHRFFLTVKGRNAKQGLTRYGPVSYTHRYELHGSTLRNYCVKCGTFYEVDFIANSTGVPRCPKCGGSVKPDVVLYEEGLDEEVLRCV